MLAPKVLPEDFARWNRTWNAPYGRRIKVPTRFKHAKFTIRHRGPFAWQPNSTTRAFEYPWAYQQITKHGSHLKVVEIGGGLSGLQFVLARDGHHVTNVDPGLAAKGRGWRLDPQFHRRLCESFGANVELAPTTLDNAGIPEGTVDIVLSVSVLEHLTDDEIDEVVARVSRLLKAGGLLVLTIDLFLDVAPFCSSERNKWGRNVDVHSLLQRGGLELKFGNPSELAGFPEFSPELIMRRLSEFMMGVAYPVLTQCVVAGKA